MIDFNVDDNAFAIKDIGRIAANYYIHHRSIEVFQTLLRPQMTEADILVMLSKSTEVCLLVIVAQIVIPVLIASQFDQVQFRESENKELEELKTIIPCEVRVSTQTRQVLTRFNGNTGGHRQPRESQYTFAKLHLQMSPPRLRVGVRHRICGSEW